MADRQLVAAIIVSAAIFVAPGVFAQSADPLAGVRGQMEDSRHIDYDDPDEMQIAWYMCSMGAAEDINECPKVMAKCASQMAQYRRAIRKDRTPPWICEDPRALRKFVR